MWLEKQSLIKKSVIEQKSKVQWLKSGDTNTDYFFAQIRNRVNQNSSTSLLNSINDRVYTQKEFEDKVIKCYKGLLGQSTTTLPSVNNKIM